MSKLLTGLSIIFRKLYSTSKTTIGFKQNDIFYHKHPYPPFIPDGATKLIVGTLPPPRFTQRNLKLRDVDFCYGSQDGFLWLVLDKIFNLGLLFNNSEDAVQQRKDFLISRKMGICDIVESSYRSKIDASDIGMERLELRDLIAVLRKHPGIETLLFTGGNSRNGPEYLFRKLLKKYSSESISLKIIDKGPPRIHQFILDGRLIKTVSLTAPSGSANRAIGSTELYKSLKKENPSFNTIDYRVLQYREFF